jgi:DNA-3-methyladenine glycosylase II
LANKFQEWKRREECQRMEERSFTEELERAQRELASRDPILCDLIRQYGPCDLRPHRDYFGALVRSILSQQLSTRAAATIHQRFLVHYGGPAGLSPATILATPVDLLRASGISARKIGYLRDLAWRVADGRLDLDDLPRLPDDGVIAQLLTVSGIGVWTAQMLLIFTLGRLDILPHGDLGIRKAIQRRYGVADSAASLPGAVEVDAIAQRFGWAPYRSVVAWYLWRSLENSPS